MTARCVLVAFIAWLVPSIASASAFTVVSVQNEILGAIAGSQDSFLPYNQYYDIISTGSLSNTVLDTNVYAPEDLRGGVNNTFASSAADMASVSVAIDQTGGAAESVAEALSTVTFRPTFNGDLDGILFYGVQPEESWFSGNKAVWSITDLTTNTLLLSEVPEVREFSQGVINNLSDMSSTITWNASDLYSLQMMIQTGSNQDPDGGSIATNLFTINVSEPATLALFAIGLCAVIIGGRRRGLSAHSPSS